MGAVTSSPLEPAWKELLSLSTRGAPEFYEKPNEVGNVPHAGALRTTLGGLGASAVFCVQHVPTAVILSVDEYDQAGVASLHASLWNQGLASLLVVIAGDTVRVFTLARVPSSGNEDFNTRCLVQALNATTDVLELRNLVYSAESGRFWNENPGYFNPEERIDRVLLENLTTSHRLLQEADLSADPAQALLVQAMFVAYLEDRGIIGEEYFQGASNEGADNFETLLRAKDVQSLERLFDTLRIDFNGDLFVAPCSFEANDGGPRLNATHLEILARFRSGSEEMYGQSGQYRLWRYDFKYIPVELISAVHDRFLGERGADDRRAQGAYYTPMFLADTVVSHVWDKLPPATKDNGSFLDPACGSGIFLVRLFQRLCEHRRETGPGPAISWDDLLDILSKLQGRDLDGGAVRVAVFSLYVALLEEVTPPDIRKLLERGRGLPALHGQTIHHGDFFAVEPNAAPVEVVIGNPPWSSRRGEQYSSLKWCLDKGLPTPGREQAWPFVWKALRHLRENGVVAFLLPAMGFLHNHAGDAVEARKRLMREARAFTVVNFADMRFQLFDGAVRPAALLLLGRPPTEGAPYRFDYLTPKADLNLKSRRLITISGADRCLLDSRIVEADPAVFKKRLWLSEPEAKLFNYLSQFPRLGNLVVEFRKLPPRKESMQNRWVVGQGFQPAHADRVQRAAYEGEHSSIVAATPYLPVAEFRSIVQECGGLRPWRDGAVRRRGFEWGFKGPRVLVPRGIAAGAGYQGQRLRAAYIEEPLTFQDIIQAIVVPPRDERRGMLLAGLLNSKLMLWFAFHGTSSFGADRPEVKQAELLRLPFPAPDDLPDRERSASAADALVAVIEKQVRPTGQASGHQSSEGGVFEEIDGLAYEFFCLSDEEKILVEDTVEHTIPAVQPSRSSLPETWRPSTPDDRRAYARTLVQKLMGWFDGDCAIGTHLVARSDDLAILRLSLRDAPGAFAYSEDDRESVAEALARLIVHIHQPLPGNFQSIPDFRVFIDRDLFLVKPAEKRFWLRSTALTDANAIALDLHAVAGRRHEVRPGQA
ncbi:MAG: N-6 DNA methylase [Spirochaetaceae bacterium]|nr:N-6 DNA methylase [Spirochaetaceae bacterium]